MSVPEQRAGVGPTLSFHARFMLLIFFGADLLQTWGSLGVRQEHGVCHWHHFGGAGSFPRELLWRADSSDLPRACPIRPQACPQLRLRGAGGASDTDFAALLGMTDEPADPDAMWESFRRFAEAKGLPPPPEDQASLPKVRSEDAEAIFQGGDGEGLDDPRLRYLYAALPEFGKTHVPHEEMIPAGAIVQVRPSQGAATAPFTGMTEAATSGAAHGAARPLKHLDGGAWAGAAPNSMDAGDAEAGSSPTPSTNGELAPYHAQVLDLPMFLASEDPADTSAHEYTFVPHLQRFDRLSGFDAALPEAPAALQQSYSLREFVRRFYPHVAAEVIDMFDASANSNVWLVAVALAPDGAALLQQIPKSWVRVLPAHALPLQAAAGLVEACAGAPSSDLSTAGEAQQISTIERPLRSSMDARGTPPGPGAAGSEQQRPGRGPMPEASGNRNVTGAREHGAGRAAGLAERMQALFKAAREGNMSQVVGLISRQGTLPLL